MISTAVGFSQDRKGERMRKVENAKETRANLTTDQIADMQAKKMTLQLDLNDSQQKQVRTLLLANATKMKERQAANDQMKAKNDAEKHQARMARLDAKIAMKKELKAILTSEQYAKLDEGKKRRNSRNGQRGSRMKK